MIKCPISVIATTVNSILFIGFLSFLSNDFPGPKTSVEIGIGARNASFNLTVNIPLGTGTAMIGHVSQHKRLINLLLVYHLKEKDSL